VKVTVYVLLGFRAAGIPLIFWFALGSSVSAYQNSSANVNEARAELFAGRYQGASSLYSKLVAGEPGSGDAWYGMVRSELGLHHSHEAYATAEQALAKAPETAGAETAAGLAKYRQGELAKAEKHFRAALKIDSDYPGALRGLASIYSAVSKPKTARDLRLRAYRKSPDDPELILLYANTLRGAEHVATLETALAKFDSETEQARNLRVHIANDRALGDRKLKRLTSRYESSRLKLSLILDGPQHARGLAIRVTLNQKETVKLLLDTGSSGLSISPRLAQKAGLEVISGESSEAKGIGDQKAAAEISYLASEVRAGDVVFADCPISVFRSAQSADFDGLIGADFFSRFLVTIDFPQREMLLEPRMEVPVDDEDRREPVDAGNPAPGFFRVYRFGDHLALQTKIEGGRPGDHSALFLMDSGSTSNLIDTTTAKEAAGVSDDPHTTVKGIQGKVDKTSRADRISLSFAGFRQVNSDLIAINLEKMGDSMGVGFGGILGMPVLSNLAVTIDYRNGSVKLDYKKP
jgi:tetratricopeptide (TPR) repeat protein